MIASQPMLAEVATAIVVAVQALATGIILAVISPDRAEVVLWTGLTMMGATVAAGGAFCFNTAQEVRKIVIGRCLFALVGGVIIPRAMLLIHPWIKDVLVDPLLVVGAGFVHGLLVYLLSWPFVKKAYERAPALANKQVQAVEKMMDAKLANTAAAAHQTLDVTIQQIPPPPKVNP